jgi:protoheme IX farnesyltransferase
MGVLYTVAAAVLGAVFTVFAWRLLKTPTAPVAMRLFSWSITYVTLLFGAMALDPFLK